MNRERRPPAVLEEDFSETEEFMRFMGETEKADLQDVFHNKDFIIVLTDVEITLRFDHTNTLFQQVGSVFYTWFYAIYVSKFYGCYLLVLQAKNVCLFCFAVVWDQ